VAKPKRVILVNRQRKLKVDSDAVRALTLCVLAEETDEVDSQVEIVFLRDPPMAELNSTYRDRLGPTDVLSFPADSEGWPQLETKLLGTVIISVDRALDQARDRDLPVDDEIQRLVAHGLLHLTGYDHHNKADAARMRRRETRYLNLTTGGR
jgi:probable rRNA maturation factor